MDKPPQRKTPALRRAQSPKPGVRISQRQSLTNHPKNAKIFSSLCGIICAISKLIENHALSEIQIDKQSLRFLQFLCFVVMGVTTG